MQPLIPLLLTGAAWLLRTGASGPSTPSKAKWEALLDVAGQHLEKYNEEAGLRHVADRDAPIPVERYLLPRAGKGFNNVQIDFRSRTDAYDPSQYTLPEYRAIVSRATYVRDDRRNYIQRRRGQVETEERGPLTFVSAVNICKTRYESTQASRQRSREKKKMQGESSSKQSTNE